MRDGFITALPGREDLKTFFMFNTISYATTMHDQVRGECNKSYKNLIKFAALAKLLLLFPVKLYRAG
jgi:hypothetical protein